MPLESGTHLGSYEILSPLGAGGMGEVYRAKDGKLDRDVAIKVLPETMTRDNERVARFEREAKVLASLNHPNIAAIHGFDDSDGARFLVMEFVEGETLQDHLKNGPVAIEDALDIAKQMAEALEAAHEQGVIHRDLKPANVMIRPDGMVKVLDFGLAKALADDPSGSEIANSPTITANYTRPGVVLGTAAYMSPEQARGRVLDKRSDIWSFGIILFECLTGETLFRGETATDSMGAIMHKDPEWSLLPPGTPPTIQLLLRRCLTKDRKRRLHDIADARIELENAIVDPSSTSLGLASVALSDEPADSAKSSALLPWALAVAGVVIGAVGFLLPQQETVPPTEPIHLSISAPKGFKFHTYDLSPDGQSIVYKLSSLSDEGNEDGHPLQLRRLSEPEAIAMRGTKGGRLPVFSPDGRWIAYKNDEKMFRVRLDGSPPVEIARLEDYRWMHCWLNDSELLVSKRSAGYAGLNANDGSLREFNEETDKNNFTWTVTAEPTPFSNKVLTTTLGFGSSATLELQLLSLDTGQTKRLLPDVIMGELTPSGHLLAARDQSLLGVRFDADQLEPDGEVSSLLAGVTRFRFSPKGILVYDGSTNWFSEEGQDIVRVPESGGDPVVLSTKRREYRGFELSPDGRRVAAPVFGFDGATPQIWILDLDTGVEQPLSVADLPAVGPIWSPDGNSIAFSVLNPHAIYVTPIDGSTEPKKVLDVEDAEDRYWVRAWADDHSVLLLNQTREGDLDIVALSLDDGSLQPILSTDADENATGLSPDEKILIYQSDVSGDWHTYLQQIDFEKGLVGVRRRLMNPQPSDTKHWSADGSALNGIDRDGQVWSVGVSLEPELTLSKAEKLQSFDSIEGLNYGSWTPSPDQKSHIFLRGDKKEDLTQLNVVLNFQTLLERRLPSGQK